MILSSVTNPLNKLLLFICLLLLSFSLGFGYLSYSFSKQIGELEESLTNCTSINRSLVLDVEKATKSCSIVDVINTENIQEQREIDTKKEELVEKVDSLPSIQSKAPQKATDKESSYVEDDGVVHLDGRLPDELIKLLQQSYNSVQEQSTPNPR